MTIPNVITLVRLALIPFYVLFAILYSRRLVSDHPDVRFRYIALGIFLVAALSDALDGYLARRLNQTSTLGKTLDPVADKLLMLSAILTLSLTNWTPSLPLWFAVLVVTRDVLIVLTVVFLYFRNGFVKMKAIKSSKFCTTFEFACIGWALFDFWSKTRPLVLDVLVVLATIFCIISAVEYFLEGRRQFRETPGKEA